MGNCINCRYAIRDPKWTDYKCALKHINIQDPEEDGCLSYQKDNRRKPPPPPPSPPGRKPPKPKPKKPGDPIDKTLVENGTFYADGDHVTGYRSVTVKVPEATTIEKTITENGTYHAADDNADGFKTVVVTIPDPVLQDKTADQNGVVKPDEGYDGLSSVTVNIPDPVLQERVIDISENGTYTIVADASFDGLVKVIINVNIEHSGPNTTAVVGRAIVGYAIAGEG